MRRLLSPGRVGAVLLGGALALSALWTTDAGAQRFSPTWEARRASAASKPRFRVVDVVWSRPLVERGFLEYQPRELGSPAVDPATGEVGVGTRDGFFRLLDGQGRVVWVVELGAAVVGQPLLSDHAVYVATADGKLHALDRFSGEALWAEQLQAQVLSAPVLVDEQLFVGTDHDSVHALDGETGESRWVYRRNTPSRLTIRGGTGVAADEEGRIFAGFSDGSLVALGQEDGRIVWQTEVAPGSMEKFPDSDAAPVVAQGMVFATVFNDGVFAFDAASGKVRWRADARGATSLSVEGDLLLVGAAERARAFQLATGAQEWSTSIGSSWVSRPVVSRRVVFLAGPEGLRMLDLATGRPLGRFQPGPGFDNNAAAREDRVWVLSNLGTLYELQVVAGEGT